MRSQPSALPPRNTVPANYSSRHSRGLREQVSNRRYQSRPPTQTRLSTNWWRLTLTAICMVAVVTVEFMLLNWVYSRLRPVAQAEVVVADLHGRMVHMPALSESSGFSRQVNAELDTIDNPSVASTSITAVRKAAQTLQAHPSTESAQALQKSVAHLGDELADRHAQLDAEEKVIYIGLLVVATLGWTIWFRRVIGRQRELQRDVTEQSSLAISERRLAALVRNSSDVVMVCDADSTISFVTASISSVLNLMEDEVIGTRLTDLLYPADIAGCLELMRNCISNTETGIQLRLQHPDGRLLIVEGTLSNRLNDPAVCGLILTFRDVTTRRELEERLSFQAFHDALTGMANRQLFSDQLAEALEKRVGKTAPVTVLLCNIEDFKTVNDSYGHRFGDEVLVEASQRIASVLRPQDLAARLDGDEFAVLMEGIDVGAGRAIAEKIQKALIPPIHVGGRGVSVCTTIGLASGRPGEVTTEDLVRNADVALYSVRKIGQSNIGVYEIQLHAQAVRRLQLRADLQRAITNNELRLMYQPTVELATGRVVGFEALVRWQHPHDGLIGPATFIPIAEETGLIVPLGAWTLQEACQAAASMQMMAFAPKMSVNLSSQQLGHPGFVDDVLTLLRKMALPPEKLVLELTETDMLHELNLAAPRLNRLREAGVQIAIDDFGTGYSSLSYLSQLPIDILKIDKSFVDGVTTNPQDASITEAIIALSHSMDFTIVAEGIEKREQADWLDDRNCTYGQGFYWSKAVDLRTARAILSAQPHRKNTAA